MNAPEQPAPLSSPGEVPHWLRALIGTPLVLLGGLITACFGLSLCAYIADRIGGEPPSLNLFNFMIGWLIFGAFPLVVGTSLLRTAPIGKRFWRWTLISVSFLFIAVGGDVGFGPNNWHHLFRREKFPGTDATMLKRTVVTPDLGTKIAKGQIYSGAERSNWLGTKRAA